MFKGIYFLWFGHDELHNESCSQIIRNNSFPKSTLVNQHIFIFKNYSSKVLSCLPSPIKPFNTDGTDVFIFTIRIVGNFLSREIKPTLLSTWTDFICPHGEVRNVHFPHVLTTFSVLLYLSLEDVIFFSVSRYSVFGDDECKCHSFYLIKRPLSFRGTAISNILKLPGRLI